MSAKTTITNQEFADRIGCHHTMASRLLNGDRTPSLELMQSICEAFAIPMATLIEAKMAGTEAFGAKLRELVDVQTT